jgi:hypothetical protein
LEKYQTRRAHLSSPVFRPPPVDRAPDVQTVATDISTSVLAAIPSVAPGFSPPIKHACGRDEVPFSLPPRPRHLGLALYCSPPLLCHRIHNCAPASRRGQATSHAWKKCTRVTWALIISLVTSWIVATRGTRLACMYHVVRFLCLQSSLLIQISVTPLDMGDGLFAKSKRRTFNFVIPWW